MGHPLNLWITPSQLRIFLQISTYYNLFPNLKLLMPGELQTPYLLDPLQLETGEVLSPLWVQELRLPNFRFFPIHFTLKAPRKYWNFLTLPNINTLPRLTKKEKKLHCTSWRFTSFFFKNKYIFLKVISIKKEECAVSFSVDPSQASEKLKHNPNLYMICVIFIPFKLSHVSQIPIHFNILTPTPTITNVR